MEAIKIKSVAKGITSTRCDTRKGLVVLKSWCRGLAQKALKTYYNSLSVKNSLNYIIILVSCFDQKRSKIAMIVLSFNKTSSRDTDMLPALELFVDLQCSGWVWNLSSLQFQLVQFPA